MSNTDAAPDAKNSHSSEFPVESGDLSTNDANTGKSEASHEDSNNPAGSSAKLKFCEKIPFETIDGVNYMQTSGNLDTARVYSIIRDLQLRDDDVILTGYPKSGIHWGLELLTMIVQHDTKFNPNNMWEVMLEYNGEEVQSRLDRFASPRVLLTHIRSHRLPSEIVTRRVKLVYLLRNPKDIAVSLYYMFNSFSVDAMRYSGSFNDFFELYLKGQFFWGYWFDHVLSIENFMKDHPECPVYIVQYEKLKENPMSIVKELCAFLGKPDDLVDEIVNATSFSNMKSTLMDGKLGKHKKMFMQEEKEGIMRKGSIGDWKNWLTEGQNQAFDKLFEERMAGSKLANLVREYM